MKNIICILALCTVCLVACKAPKNVITDTNVKEQKDIEKDISLIETKDLKESFDRALQSFFNEKLNINITQTKYDTDKPTDTGTGKPPVKEVNDISISRETDAGQLESSKKETTENTALQLEDKSKDKSKVEVKEKTETETGLVWWQNTLIVIGSVVIIYTCVKLYLKFK